MKSDTFFFSIIVWGINQILITTCSAGDRTICPPLIFVVIKHFFMGVIVFWSRVLVIVWCVWIFITWQYLKRKPWAFQKQSQFQTLRAIIFVFKNPEFNFTITFSFLWIGPLDTNISRFPYLYTNQAPVATNSRDGPCVRPPFKR